MWLVSFSMCELRNWEAFGEITLNNNAIWKWILFFDDAQFSWVFFGRVKAWGIERRIKNYAVSLRTFAFLWFDLARLAVVRWLTLIKLTFESGKQFQYSRIKCNTIYDNRGAQHTAIKTNQILAKHCISWAMNDIYVWFQLK